jgi:hypothetical protein
MSRSGANWKQSSKNNAASTGNQTKLSTEIPHCKVLQNKAARGFGQSVILAFSMSESLWAAAC